MSALKKLLGTFVTKAGALKIVGDNIQGFLDAHSNDINDVHGLRSLRETVSALDLRAASGDLYAVVRDDFQGADAALAGRVPPMAPAGSTWRAYSGVTGGNIIGNQFGSGGGGLVISLTDIPGHAVEGVYRVQARIATLGSGDFWLYGWASDTNNVGVLVQRGSDRIRLQAQNTSLTMLVEYMVPFTANEVLAVVLDADTQKASVRLNGAEVIPPTAVPAWTRGQSVGLRASATARADQFRVLEKVVG